MVKILIIDEIALSFSMTNIDVYCYKHYNYKTNSLKGKK